jgi:hypothetical protein
MLRTDRSRPGTVTQGGRTDQEARGYKDRTRDLSRDITGSGDRNDPLIQESGDRGDPLSHHSI